jgi:type IV pilus assembly protein PilY1
MFAELSMSSALQLRARLQRLSYGVAFLALALTTSAANATSLAETPPFLPSPLAPNIVLTLDDSGSMRWAYAPEDMCDIELNSATRGARRTKSSDFNSLYYDPKVRYDPPVDAGGTALATSFTSAYINGLYTAHGTVNLSTSYRVTWAYDPSSNGGSTVSIACGNITPGNMVARNNSTDYPGNETNAVPAYYYVYDPVTTACASAATTNDACYRRVVVSSTSGPAVADLNNDGVVNSSDADERQNFANWYSFYRTRNLLTATSASRAMAQLPSSVRFAWQSLNTCNTFGTSCTGWGGSAQNNKIRRFADIAGSNPLTTVNHRSAFYNWLFRFPANSGTPLRTAATRAGDYFTTSGNNSPYGVDPNQTATVSGTEYACRPNFHILMTDGLWNDSTGNFCSGSQCNNADGTGGLLPAGKLPDGTTYDTSSSQTRIYRDSSNDTLADIAFHYWAKDLRTDLTNKLIPYYADRTGTATQQYWNPKNDPATWQHVVTFTVGLGLSKTLVSPGLVWAGGTYSGDAYTNLLSGSYNWPAASSNSTPGNVYDLWHAAINSRGQAFAADNPTQLATALKTALNRILERTTASAALATNSTRLSTDTMLFQARFDSTDWSGQIRAFRLNSDGSLGSTLWQSTDAGKIPGYASRYIYTWSGTAGINFTQADLTTAGLWSYVSQTPSTTPPLAADDLLKYLRGDATREVKNLNGSYRSRSQALGDIINSDPLYVGAENFGYTSLPEGSRTGTTPYNDFVTTKGARRKMLFVGGNDGMLHGFDALTGDEKFAYIPYAVMPKLRSLSSTTYAHTYFVDGAPSAWDAFFGGGWKTVLTGTTGAGARSVFALDVTDPDSFSTSKILWEINNSTAMRTGDAVDPNYANDLGFTFGQAVVAKLNNGEWAAIFGNGYRSDSLLGPAAKAVLYIVRISDGTLIRKIDTGIGTAAIANGLGTPTLYDSDGDDVYDYVYAPDMYGNVWKFNLTGSNTSAWGIAYPAITGFPNGAPFFQARSSATSGPLLSRNTAQPIQARIELASPPSGVTGVMVLFGTGRFIADGDNVNDQLQSFYGLLDNGSRITTTDRSELVQQTISAVTGGRNVTQNSVNYTTKRGWFMDLPTSTERVIGTALIRAGRAIFTTVVPSTDPCDFGGTGWLMEVDAKTGGMLPYSVFDTNGDGLVNDNDTTRAGVALSVGIAKQPVAIDGPATAVKAMSGTSGNIQIERNRTFGTPLGRDSWREVIK